MGRPKKIRKEKTREETIHAYELAAMRRQNYTLCWDCKKACGDCDWSRWKMQMPVEGWEAIEIPARVLKNGSVVGKSYKVLTCPDFERDAWHYGLDRVTEAEWAEG